MRALGAVGTYVLGVVIAVAAVVVARMDLRALGVTWPFGLVFAVVAQGLFMVQAYRAMGRAAGIAAVLGWASGIALCLWPRPEGDVAIASDANGMVLLLGGIAAAAWTLVRSLSGPGRRRPGSVDVTRR